MRKRLLWLTLAAVVSAVAVVWLTAAGPAGAARAATQIPLSGTGSPHTGDFTPSGEGSPSQDEFPSGEDSEEGPDPYNGTISFSSGTGGGPSVNSGTKAKSNPTFNSGFEGLNHYQQRYSRGGNQFSVEPPDQGMCVGNGYVVEAVNDVMNVFSYSGVSQLPDNTSTNIVAGFPRNVNHAVDLNSFYGYAPAINRSTGVRAQFVTDPSCYFDAATQRFFMVVLTLETTPAGAFTHVNHLISPSARRRTRRAHGTSIAPTSRMTERTPVEPIPVRTLATTRTSVQTRMGSISPRMLTRGAATASAARRSTRSRRRSSPRAPPARQCSTSTHPAWSTPRATTDRPSPASPSGPHNRRAPCRSRSPPAGPNTS